MDDIQQQLIPQTPAVLTMDDVNERLGELVTSQFSSIVQALADMDYAKIGVVSKDDFKEILKQFSVRLPDEHVRLYS